MYVWLPMSLEAIGSHIRSKAGFQKWLKNMFLNNFLLDHHSPMIFSRYAIFWKYFLMISKKIVLTGIWPQCYIKISSIFFAVTRCCPYIDQNLHKTKNSICFMHLSLSSSKLNWTYHWSPWLLGVTGDQLLWH